MNAQYRVFKIELEKRYVYAVLLNEYIEKIMHELKSHFKFTETSDFEADGASWVIYSYIDDVGHTGLEKFVELRNDEPNNVVWYNLSSKKIYIDNENIAYRERNTIRMIRNVFRWILLDDGFVYLHGGVVDYSGEGIAILGNKNAGKTSTVLSILHDTDFRYVVNDDISLKISDSMKLLGSPRAVGMNTDTLPYLPKIDKYTSESDLLHPTNQYNSKIDIIELTIQEIAAALNNTLLKTSKLKRIIFPEWENGIEKSYLLESNCDDAKCRLRTNIDAKPDKHSDFLLRSYDLYNNFDEIANEIISKVPTYILRQNLSTLWSNPQVLKETIYR